MSSRAYHDLLFGPSGESFYTQLSILPMRAGQGHTEVSYLARHLRVRVPVCEKPPLGCLLSTGRPVGAVKPISDYHQPPPTARRPAPTNPAPAGRNPTPSCPATEYQVGRSARSRRRRQERSDGNSKAVADKDPGSHQGKTRIKEWGSPRSPLPVRGEQWPPGRSLHTGPSDFPSRNSTTARSCVWAGVVPGAAGLPALGGSLALETLSDSLRSLLAPHRLKRSDGMVHSLLSIRFRGNASYDRLRARPERR